MNIAWVSDSLPYLPSCSGFRLYGGNLIPLLSRRHRIDLISFLREDDQEHLDWARKYCAAIRTIHTRHISLPERLADALWSYGWGSHLHYRRDFQAILPQGLRDGKWDVLHVEGPFAAGLVPPDLPVPKVLSVHDSGTLRCQEMLRCAQSFGEKLHYTLLSYQEPRYERLVYPRFGRCVVVAQRDLEAVRNTVPACSAELIPNGVDTDYFYPLPVENESATVVFHGHLGYTPNVEAALHLANEILPLIQAAVPSAALHLVGADPDPKVRALASRPGIKLSANLPDLRQAVRSGRIYACAVRHGTGVKNKVLEAMAMQMPIVGYYPASIAGIDCEPGRHLLTAEKPREFAAAVLSLLRDPNRAQELARAARRLAQEKYSWESSARAYEELYHQVIGEWRARTSA